MSRLERLLGPPAGHREGAVTYPIEISPNGAYHGANMDPGVARRLDEVLRARREGAATIASFPKADLSDALCMAADLAGANLEGANLENACLAGAKLSRANLRHANLRGVDFDGADLTDADLSGADLTLARLDDAVLTRSRLVGACLESTLGDPLSMTAALVDRSSVERSRFRMRDVAQLVIRGADVREREVLDIEPSEAPAPAPPGAPEGASPSILLELRALEVLARGQRAREDEEVPPSLRAQRGLSTLIREGRTEDAAPPSTRDISAPQSSRLAGGFKLLPEPGETYLGVRIDEPLGKGTTSRAYLGTSPTGQRVVVRVFDATCPHAPLQLPAFQRGVRALNRLQALDDPELHVAELLAVATDLTAYVARHYDNGSITNLMDVAMTLEGGLEIVRALTRSIHRANEQGVLVRALKPSNVLIDGLTPLIGEIDAVDLVALSAQSGNLAGYGNYAAPEEIVGAGTRSPTSDVYLVGKLLEYLLTGTEPTAPVGAPSPLAARPGVPQVLLEIVEKSTQPSALDRYQYVGELLEELESFAKTGAHAALRASLRPGAISRLKAAPALDSKVDAPSKRRDAGKDAPARGKRKIEPGGGAKAADKARAEPGPRSERHVRSPPPKANSPLRLLLWLLALAVVLGGGYVVLQDPTAQRQLRELIQQLLAHLPK